MSRRLNKEDLTAVADAMWGDGEPDDICKLMLAERLISEKYRQDGKQGKKALSVAEVGMLAKDRLGDKWPSSAQRSSAGMPRLVDVLEQDPFIKTTGSAQSMSVALDLQRFAELVGQAQAKPVRGTADETQYPAREGMLPCSHYARHGWCAFRERCLYHHPKPGTPGGPKLEKLTAKQQAEQKRLKQAEKQAAQQVQPTKQQQKQELRQQIEQDRASQRRTSVDVAAERRASDAAAALAEAAAGPSSSAEAGGSGSNGDGQAAEGSVTRANNNCPHYMAEGWCKSKVTCTFDHPPLPAEVRSRLSFKIRSAPGTSAAPAERTPSDAALSHTGGTGSSAEGATPAEELVAPMRPVLARDFLPVSPAPQDPSQAATPAAQSAAAAAAAGPSPATGPRVQGIAALLGTKPYPGYKPKVRQPQKEDLVALIVDGLYPPLRSKDDFLRGALVKYLVSGANKDIEVLQEGGRVVYQLLSAKAGAWLKAHWRTDHPDEKPYNSLNELLQKDEGAWVQVGTDAKKVSCVLVDYTRLIQQGAAAAAERFGAMADLAWPPGRSKDQWLCGSLAKHIVQMRFISQGEELMRVPAGTPTAFRMPLSTAGMVLRGLWTAGGHSFSASAAPYDSLHQLLKGDPYFYVEPAPDNADTPHVTLDVAKLISNWPTLYKRARGAAGATVAATAGPSSSAGLPSPGPSGSGLRRVASSVSRASSSSALGELQQEDVQAQQGVANGSSTGPSAAPSRHISDDGSWQQVGARGGAAPAAPAGGSGFNAEAPRVERWWPPNEPIHHNWAWAEACAVLVQPEEHLQVAEMCQHLEACQILGLACANYQKIPHMLQIFAPYVSVMGLQLPATAYVLDLISQREVAEVMAMIKPVLESRHVVKVCHGSKLWAGLLRRYFGITLRAHYDTQAGHAALCYMREQAGQIAPKQAADISFASLLGHYSFHHPIRHDQAGQKNSDKNRLLWQVRPISDDLFVCAAADVALLVPALEMQLPQVQAAAAELLRFHTRTGRAPPRQADSPIDGSLMERLAQGTGGSMQKLLEWAHQPVFHQEPMPGYA